MARKVGFDQGQQDEQGDGAGKDMRKQRLIIGTFLTLWLAVWTYGIFLVGSALVGPVGSESGVGALAMGIWLVIAVIGWFVGINFLRRILSGDFPRHKPTDPNAPRPKLPPSDPGGNGDL